MWAAPLAALVMAAFLSLAAPARAGEPSPGLMLAKGGGVHPTLQSGPSFPKPPSMPKMPNMGNQFRGHRQDPVIIHRLPHGHMRIRHHHEDYYYHHGHYFRHHERGFITVMPPSGMVVPFLPFGYTTMWVGGSPYYYYHGTYYSQAPNGYVVVAPPPAALIPPAPVPAPAPAPPASAAASPYGSVTVTAPSLNVRSGPGRQFDVVKVIQQGGAYTVSATAPNWVYIQLPDGQFGWVERIFTAPVDPPAPSG